MILFYNPELSNTVLYCCLLIRTIIYEISFLGADLMPILLSETKQQSTEVRLLQEKVEKVKRNIS